jgi:hypothetical protein
MGSSKSSGTDLAELGFRTSLAATMFRLETVTPERVTR